MEKHEYLKSDSKGKKIFYFKDEENKIDIISREVKDNYTIFYPRGIDGLLNKYGNVKKIILKYNKYKTIPIGMVKSVYYGWGFTKPLHNGVLSLLKIHTDINEILIEEEIESEISGKKLLLNRKDVEDMARIFKRKDGLNKSSLKQLFESEFFLKISNFEPSIQQIYEKDSVQVILRESTNFLEEYSSNDVTEISNAYQRLIESGRISNSDLVNQKLKFDTSVLDKIVLEFENILLQENGNESKWQSFFKKNLLLLNSGYVRFIEKTILPGMKIPDFLMLTINNFFDIYEIKHHKTKLLQLDESRNNLYFSTEFSKAISQCETYFDVLKEGEASLKEKLRVKHNINVSVIRPKAIIIAGTRGSILSDLDKKRCKVLGLDPIVSLRILSSALKNTDLILYDDLLNSFKNSLKLMTKKLN